jgi:hypothetical protein
LALYLAIDPNRCKRLLVRGEATFMDEEVFHAFLLEYPCRFLVNLIIYITVVHFSVGQ